MRLFLWFSNTVIFSIFSQFLSTFTIFLKNISIIFNIFTIFTRFLFFFNLQKRHLALEESEEIPHAGIVFGEKIWNAQVVASAGFFTAKSRSKALMDMYENCDAIPNMDALQLHRNDGKECKKMYSDPQWFFRIWRDQILAQNERQKVKKKRKIKKVDARTTVKAQKKILTTAVSFTHCYKKSNFCSKIQFWQNLTF